MNPNEHYMTILMSPQAKRAKDGIVSITVQELAEILYCTPRNVKMTLRKLIEDGYIEWRGGVGRGNPSQMRFLRDLEDVVGEQFLDLLDKGKIKEVMDLLYHKDLPLPLRNKLRGQLDQRFGHRVEQKDTASVDVLRVKMTRRSASLDPAFVSSSAEAFILRQICNTLVSFDPRTNTYTPALAHDWECNEDGSRWTFFLRKGVRFHHGRPLTSKDVRYTLERLQEVNSPSRWQYREIERVEIESDHVISFSLRRPNRMFLHFFGSFYMSILPYDVEYSERTMIGTGPFRISEFTDQAIVLEAHEDYFLNRPLLDRVEWWLMPKDTPDDLYQLPRLGSAPLPINSPSGEFESVLEGCAFIVFNFRKKGIHHHRAFRQSVRLLFDRLAIIQELKGNRIAPADSFFSEKSKHAHYGRPTLEEAAASLLESGYRGEMLKLYYLDRKELRDDARWLQQRCELIGLHISLHPFSLSEYYTTDADQEADLLLINEALEDDTEWGYLRLLQDEASFVHRFFDYEQHAWVEEYLDSMVQLPSRDLRDRIVDRIEQEMRHENWVLFGYHINRVSKHHPALHGIYRDSFGWIDFTKAWVRKGAKASSDKKSPS